MRKTAALIVTVGLVAALSACSSAPAASSDCVPSAKPGSSSNAIKVTGAPGTAPTVDIPTPLKAPTTERTVLDPGSGVPAGTGQKVTTELTVVDGTTGDVIEASQYNGSNAVTLMVNSSTLTGLAKGLKCSMPGSRVAVAVAPKDGLGPNGAQLGVGPDDTLVFVLDVTKVYLGRANGVDQPAEAGFPSVVLAADGTPGITIPPANPPKDLKIALLKKGDGETVKKGQNVTMNYTGVLWDTGKVFDSSWTKDQPAQYTTDAVVPGFSAALVGKKVGSQVIAIVPPKDGYKDKANGAVPANSTLVFVIDILGVDPAPPAQPAAPAK